MPVPRRHRIVGQHAIQRVQKMGKKIRVPLFLFTVHANNKSISRVAIIIPSKLVPHATDRNLLRRQISAMLAPLLAHAGADIVIRVTRPIVDKAADEIKREIQNTTRALFVDIDQKP